MGRSVWTALLKYDLSLRNLSSVARAASRREAMVPMPDTRNEVTLSEVLTSTRSRASRSSNFAFDFVRRASCCLIIPAGDFLNLALDFLLRRDLLFSVRERSSWRVSASSSLSNAASRVIGSLAASCSLSLRRGSLFSFPGETISSSKAMVASRFFPLTVKTDDTSSVASIGDGGG